MDHTNPQLEDHPYGEVSSPHSSSFAEATGTKINHIIRRLMQLRGLKEADLARQVQLPQTTVNRILTQDRADPRLSTLIPIAQFLGLTLGQIAGLEPIPEALLKNNHSFYKLEPLSLKTIPLIPWDHILDWIDSKILKEDSTYKGWLCTERSLGPKAFVLEATPLMEAVFPAGSRLLVDPSTYPLDGCYVVLTLKGNRPTLRRVLNDGSDIYLKSIDEQLPYLKLSPQYRILGTVVEFRENCI
jgi:SOS-response transcriptional repressor LexA/DNA-binding phage protein